MFKNIIKKSSSIFKVRDSWCQIFDYNYIDDFVISGIDDKLVEIADLLAHISEKATGKKSELVESLKETSKIFCFTIFIYLKMKKKKLKKINLLQQR